jgi:hypothetical protein
MWIWAISIRLRSPRRRARRWLIRAIHSSPSSASVSTPAARDITRPSSHSDSFHHGSCTQNDTTHGTSPTLREAALQDRTIRPDFAKLVLPIPLVIRYAAANTAAWSLVACGTAAAITAIPPMPRNTARRRTLSATTLA